MCSVCMTHMDFPVELTEEYAEEEGMKFDQDGFENEMEAQRDRARSARQDVDLCRYKAEFLVILQWKVNLSGTRS